MSYQGLQRQYWKRARERVMKSVEIKKIKKKNQLKMKIISKKIKSDNKKRYSPKISYWNFYQHVFFTL